MEKKERSDGGSSSSISLIDLVFSWSIQDVLNTNLYKALVKKIPETFKSTAEYLNSFLAPLIEETHADLFSSMTRLARAPSREVFSVERDKDYKAPRDLFYKIVLRRDSNGSDHLVTYQPQTGDLVALTNVRPDCISDLNGPKFSYLLAYVQAVDSDNVSILSSKPVMTEQKTLLGQRSQNISQQKHTLFFVFLINMTTNIRIWKALHPDLKGGNLKMINKVIEMNGADEEDCAMCLYQKNCVTVPSFKSYGLNDSQEAVIISCINSWCCNHQNTVKLVWGPPGTGKTKIAGLLLLSLLRMKCRTITCAPTNIAALEVTSRLMRLVAGTLEYDTYGFGDIVLFGNIERMRINDHEDLLDVFLDYRVEILDKCFSPLSGWKISLVSMINLLEDPQEQYGRYLANRGLGNSDANNEMENENCDENLKDTSRNPWKKVIMESSKQKETNKKQVTHENENHSKPEKEEDRYGASLEKTNAQEAETCMDDSITLEEFVKERFSVFNERLKFCTVNLYTHLPTQFISLELVKSMMMALDMLRSLETLFNCFNFGDEGFREALADTEKGSEVSDMAKLGVIRQNCLQILKSLPLSFSVPEFTQKFLINNFCLDNACLLFCTASSSSKLSTERTRPLDLLVIDEAAQLKECESTIPFQLPGLRHAVLIGDERQLPAVIHSKAKFGRSLFERLVLLGQKKQLLNVQYRMHPAISSFPNNEFYDGKILDAAIVKHRSHEKRFLHGNMYGAYSFINVASGKEQLDHLPGRKNMVEVAVVCKIVASLFNEFTGTKQRICIGVISPYKAQVLAIQEKLEKKYTGYADSGFAVSIATVDGFQGNEKDVVIVSTVRCNINGSVGFLSNRQRANVALTRARHCLWVLGNEATFVKSNSVWKKLVADAKRRGCFFNADEDKHLAEAIVTTLIELEQFDTLLSMDSPLFKKARWRVCFSNDFWKSLASINNIESYKQMLNLLEKLSSGWRQTPDQQKNHIVVGGCFGLLEVYPVDDSLNLLWSVDIIKENSNFIQVLKVWDILPLMDIPKAERNLRILFGEYTENKISRCKYQCLEGNLVVPMKWEVEDSRTQGTGHGDESMESSSKYVPEFVENVHASGNINSFSFYLLGVVIVVIAFKFLMFKEN
ncbi:uncharacterized protein LOC111294754 [Durio zibethinus]|uniref:Uncharacterized protein LOC111294754 n=1 Tax=Durio zibethinus TaxID=66656 RepID=A0A6P5YUB6_DURZI|nr:uncharacterized protein LOC111294754 [Durio zibethinus]